MWSQRFMTWHLDYIAGWRIIEWERHLKSYQGSWGSFFSFWVRVRIISNGSQRKDASAFSRVPHLCLCFRRVRVWAKSRCTSTRVLLPLRYATVLFTPNNLSQAIHFDINTRLCVWMPYDACSKFRAAYRPSRWIEAQCLTNSYATF